MPRFWKNKKVLVVGGAGFIGSHTADALIRKGAKVVILDDLSNGRKANCHSRAKFYKADAASPRDVDAVFKKEKPDFVFMFAALTNVPLGLREPLLDSQSILALVNVCEHAVQYRVKKLLFASSGFVYGNAKRRPTPESEAPQPLSPYSISKAACENYLKFFHSYYGLPFVILRYGTVYGPRQYSGALVDYMNKIHSNKRAEIYGNKTRDYIFVADVVTANLKAMEKRYYKGEPIFNIASGREVGLAEMYSLIAKVLHCTDNKPIFRAGRPGEMDRFCLNTATARHALNFAPETSLEEGMRITIAGFLKTQKKMHHGK